VTLNNLFKTMIVLVLLIASVVHVEAASLKFVKSFGTGTDEFFFRAIKGAVISKNKDIYVVDYKGCYIAWFDWNGKFIKKLGQWGQGNGDLIGPKDIRIYGDKIFFNDFRNRRIVETDYKLTKLTYRKIYGGQGFTDNWHMIGPNKCVGHCISYSVDFEKEYKVMKLLDFETQESTFFFDKTPIGELTPKQILSNRYWAMTYVPVFTIDTESKQVILSFMFPNNPVENYIYSYTGELMDRFSYVFDKHYKFPEHKRTGSKRPKEFDSNVVYRLFVHKGHFISFIGKSKITGREVDSDRYLLVFDKKTKALKHRIPVPKNLYFNSITDEGYVIGHKEYEDEIKIYIYQLTL